MTKNISKTLIIGLGGTGQRVICDIKKRLLRTYGEIPNLVKFLEFDTDAIDNKDSAPFNYYYGGETHEDYQYRIAPREFYFIPDPGIEAVSRNPVCSEKLDLDILRDVSERHRGAGAGGYRIQGRACFLNSSQGIINMLSIAIRDLRNAMLPVYDMARGYNVVNNDISVFVVVSLAGGTGSSAIMDISRMLQIAGLNVSNAPVMGTDKIFGVFFLPKFFVGFPNTPNVCVNAFTALSELDYTMGLADPTRYELGCIELEDDRQDYAGYTNNGKRVIYDNVFLIDSLPNKGHARSFVEATKHVASFIASSIAADSQAIMSSYVNSNHKRYEVDGKFQNYSSLGYCELRFNRQELVRYLLNKKITDFVEDYKTGDNLDRPSQIAMEFIMANKLDEGVMKDASGADTRAQHDELIDSIVNMADWKLTGITIKPVDVGEEAATSVVTSKTDYLTKIGITVSELIEAFGGRRDELMQSLRALLDKHMTGKGFVGFPDLARSLKSLFTAMKDGLEDELRRNDIIFNRIDQHELQQRKINIAENSSRGFLGIGSKHPAQEAAIRSYFNKVRFSDGNAQHPTLAWLMVDTARKKEAVAIYEEMIGIVDSYYKEEMRETVNGQETTHKGRFMSVDGLYKVLMDTLLRAISGYQPSMAATNETVFADAYFKAHFEQHWDETVGLNQQAANELNKYIGELFAQMPTIDEAKLEEMRQMLLGLLPADGLVRKIQAEEMSIDELFIHCFGNYGDILDKDDIEGNPQLKMLRQVDDLFDTLWSYLNFNGQGLQPVKNMVVGVCDTSDHIFDTNHGYEATISGWNRYKYISLGDPDRIAFMLMETAIPAFKLEGVDAWASDFKQRRGQAYTYTDKRLENIEMIKPGVNDEAEIAWAYGWLFGLITNSKKKNGVRVRPTYEYITRKPGRAQFKEPNGDYNYFKNESDIYVCHQKFINDLELSKDILDQAMQQLYRDPIDSIIKIIEWVNYRKMWHVSVRGKLEGSLRLNEKEVIENEPKYLAMRFNMLEGYGLTLSNGKVSANTYSEELERRKKALEEKYKETPESEM